jgi:hypothetical protein
MTVGRVAVRAREVEKESGCGEHWHTFKTA